MIRHWLLILLHGTDITVGKFLYVVSMVRFQYVPAPNIVRYYRANHFRAHLRKAFPSEGKCVCLSVLVRAGQLDLREEEENTV